MTWQTIQLLLGPEEHVPFLQNAVREFDIIDTATGAAFPKVLPKEAFPEHPNQEMLDWYDQVYEQLRADMQSSPDAQQRRSASSQSEMSSSDASGDEKSFAASYFRNPMFRDTSGRPTVVRRFSRQPSAHGTRQVLEDRSRAVMQSVRHFWSPHAMNRESAPPPPLPQQAATSNPNPSSHPSNSRDRERETIETPLSALPSRYFHTSPWTRR